jgi:hypothetical protein
MCRGNVKLKAAVLIFTNTYLDWLQTGTLYSNLVDIHSQDNLPREECGKAVIGLTNQIGNPVFGKTWEEYRDEVIESLRGKYPGLTPTDRMKAETIRNIYSWTDETSEEATFNQWAFGKHALPNWLYETADLHHKSPRRPIRRKRAYRGRRPPTTEQEQARRHLKRRLEDALLKGTLGDDFRKKEVKTIPHEDVIDVIPDPKAERFRECLEINSIMVEI